MQCARPCHGIRYPSLEVAEKLSAAEQGGRVPAELVPRCPRCGGPMDIHMGAVLARLRSACEERGLRGHAAR